MNGTMEWMRVIDTVGAWLSTYLLHSAVLLIPALLLARFLGPRRLSLQESVLRVALVGGLLTATIQVGFGWQPATGTIAVQGLTTAAPIEVVATDTPNHGSHRRAAHSERGRSAVSTATSQPTTASTETGAVPWLALAVAVWLMGSLLLVARLSVLARSLHRQLQARREITEGNVFQVFWRLLAAADIDRPTRLSRTSHLKVPVALGIGRREICLPERVASQMPREQQETVLAHELAHLERRDPIWLLVGRAIESLFFFQPLNRVARGKLQEIAEFRCDDWAAERTGRPLTLARCLTEVATWSAATRMSSLAPTMAGNGSSLGRRVRRLLDPGYSSLDIRLSAWWRPIALGALLLVLVAVPGFSVGSQSDAVPEAEESQPMVAPVVAKVPQSAALAPMIAPQSPLPVTDPDTAPKLAAESLAPVSSEPIEGPVLSLPADAPLNLTPVLAPALAPAAAPLPDSQASPTPDAPAVPAVAADPESAEAPRVETNVVRNVRVETAIVPNVQVEIAVAPRAELRIVRRVEAPVRVRLAPRAVVRVEVDDRTQVAYSAGDASEQSAADDGDDSAWQEEDDWQDDVDWEDRDDWEGDLDDQLDAMEDEIDEIIDEIEEVVEEELEVMVDSLEDELEVIEESIEEIIEDELEAFEEELEAEMESFEYELEALEDRIEDRFDSDGSERREERFESRLERIEDGTDNLYDRLDDQLDRIEERLEIRLERTWERDFEHDIEDRVEMISKRAEAESERLAEMAWELAERAVDEDRRLSSEERELLMEEARRAAEQARPTAAEMEALQSEVLRLRDEALPSPEELEAVRAELRTELEEVRAQAAAGLVEQRQALQELQREYSVD